MNYANDAARDRVIVALDMGAGDARLLAEQLKGRVRWLKVGMTLFYEAGPAIVTELREQGFDVFLDLKLHDISHQVRGATERISRLGAGMLTVHASGGTDMVKAAVEGATVGALAAGVDRPAVLAVTVLTSMDGATLLASGVPDKPAVQVPRLAGLAARGGADGIVCSPEEAATVRELLGERAYVVTPGVRPTGSTLGDQSRVATPAAALRAGSSHLVIGRPITEAADPVAAFESIVTEIEESMR